MNPKQKAVETFWEYSGVDNVDIPTIRKIAFRLDSALSVAIKQAQQELWDFIKPNVNQIGRASCRERV